jgi:outer membrane protein assembly factor BamA
VFSPNRKIVDIELRIQEGYRSKIDTIIFKGFDALPDFLLRQVNSNQKISQGEPYDRALLEAEVARVRTILWNEGWANATLVRDSSSARRYVSTGNYKVIIAFDWGKRYKFGTIHIAQDTTEAPREDITDAIILNQLDYAPERLFSEQDRRNSERNLNRLGIFDQARVDVFIPPNADTSDHVTSYITLRPRDKHELAPELILSDENKTFNLGTGLSYTQRNFFGGARTFTTRLRFRTQTIREFPDYFNANNEAVSNVDLTFEMLQPYIFTNKIKGSWTFSLILDKQKPYLQRIVRNRFGFNNHYAEFTTAFLDWTLEGSSLEKNDNFVRDTTDPNILKDIRLLEEQEKQTQFNSILSFTIQRDKSNDIFSPSAGFVHSLTVEEAGLIPLLLKKTVQLPFTQFYRLSSLGRWYFDLTTQRFSILAVKLKGGFEEKYGESRSNATRGIPQTHRFYAGGGGSVRGWNSRDLSASGDPQFGGNLAFEGSLEIRTNIFQSFRDDFLDNIWIVTFLDFGNVWSEISDFQPKGIAIASGIGFRYDTFFGPFRIDYGFRVYNPRATPGQHWIADRKLFKQTLKEGILHFGIGHAF